MIKNLCFLLVFSFCQDRSLYDSLFDDLFKNQEVIEKLDFISFKDSDKNGIKTFRVSEIAIPQTSNYVSICNNGKVNEGFNLNSIKSLKEKSKNNGAYVIYFSDIIKGHGQCKISLNSFKEDTLDSLKSNIYYGKILLISFCLDQDGKLSNIKVERLHVG